jgi:chromate transport protein ChrA
LFLNNSDKPLGARGVSDIMQKASLKPSPIARQMLIDNMREPTIRAHYFRHTCAVVRLAHFKAAGIRQTDALEKLRAFFGWSFTSTVPQLYGAAQAVPGPLFTFSAYLGAVLTPSPHGVPGAVLSLIAIFLPGVLVLMGTLRFWKTFRRRAGAQAIMRGVNASVVGLLGAALYNPIWTSAVKTPGDFGLALVGFVLLIIWRAPPPVVVLISALGGIGLVYLPS